MRRAELLLVAVRASGARLGHRGAAHAVEPEGARMALVWCGEVGRVAKGSGLARQRSGGALRAVGSELAVKAGRLTTLVHELTDVTRGAHALHHQRLHRARAALGRFSCACRAERACRTSVALHGLPKPFCAAIPPARARQLGRRARRAEVARRAGGARRLACTALVFAGLAPGAFRLACFGLNGALAAKRMVENASRARGALRAGRALLRGSKAFRVAVPPSWAR